MIDGVGETWYAKPDAGNLIISPADKEMVGPHDAWADDETLAVGVESFQGVINVPIDRMLSNWAGLRSFAPDGNLVIGPDKNNPSFSGLLVKVGMVFKRPQPQVNYCPIYFLREQFQLSAKYLRLFCRVGFNATARKTTCHSKSSNRYWYEKIIFRLCFKTCSIHIRSSL